MANLFLLTSYFPFGTGEPFLESEIKYACKAFDTVYIIPAMKIGEERPIPCNAVVLEPEIKSNKDFLKYGINKQSTDIKSVWREFNRLKAYKSLSRLRSFLISLLILNSLKHSKQIKRVLELVNPDDIVYSYWGYSWGFTIPFTDFNGAKLISRFHGSDLYEYLPGVMLPFRKELLKKLDLAVFISKDGQAYTRSRYPGLECNSTVSYLGTTDCGMAKKKDDNILRVVSCSFVKPVKRVDLIFKALQELNNPNIEWTHIGGGELFEDLKALIEKSPHAFKVNLLGAKSNHEVKEILRNGGFDVFVNVSSSEGLPVSIMEAISFGIPVIGTDVGGTPEIVTEETGILISANPDAKEVGAAIMSLSEKSLNPREFWERNFNADTNYKKFYNYIKSL